MVGLGHYGALFLGGRMEQNDEVSGYAVQHTFTGTYFVSGNLNPFYFTRFLSQARVYLDEHKARRVAAGLTRRHGGIFITRVISVHFDQLARTPTLI